MKVFDYIITLDAKLFLPVYAGLATAAPGSGGLVGASNWTEMSHSIRGSQLSKLRTDSAPPNRTNVGVPIVL